MSASSCCLSASQILASSPPALQGSPLSSPLTIILINGVTIKILLPLLVLAISLFYVLYLQQRYDHHDAYRQRNKDLPPGSMGWPYVGETLKLYTQNPNSFFSNRQERYGDIFKSHILGCPCVMISNPEAAKLILVSKAHMFKPTYPPSKMKMIGPQALFFHQGDYHSSLKRLIQASFTPSSVASSVSEIESIALNLLIPAWERSINDGNGHNTVINTLREMKKFAFEVAMISVFGHKRELELAGIKQLYQCLEKGYNSMPLNFPGTPFRKAMKARKKLNETLKKLISKRRETNEQVDHQEGGGGLLGVLLRSDYILNDSQISDNIVGVIFAAHDTTASVLTWMLKYLHDNQHLLQAVRIEQEDIRKRRTEEDNRGLTWADTKNMPLTSRIIQETLRTASVLSFTFREAVDDVELGGYLIPKGWKVLPLFRRIHHCAKFFPHPDRFDPSRFEVSPRPNTYMPFGNGVHSCPGSELAKLEMLVFLHHLTTTYRWEVEGDEDGIQYGPFPVPKHGLPIKLYRRD